MAIKQIQAKHKFVLTGTPIQNNLMEIWGIFDFLMPGYLGEGLMFKKYFQKNFDNSRIMMKNDQIIFSQQQSLSNSSFM